MTGMQRLFLPALLVLTGSASAQAQNSQCKITASQAQEIAVKQVAGTVMDTDIERTANGKCYWSVDVKPTNGAEKEVNIDGQTGSVMSIEEDSD